MGSYVKNWIGGRLLRRAGSGGLDLARLRVIPRSVSMPLRRHGVDPIPELAKVRATEPVHLLKRLFGLNIWIVTGYDEARAVLADTTRFSNDIRPLVGGGTNAGADGIGGLGFTDPPEHTRLRRYLTPEFTMRRLARLEPVIAEIVDRQLDAVAAAGPVADLVPAFAFPVPFQVICELLGLPVEDRERFRQLGPARFDLSRGGVGVFGSATESRSFLFEMVAKQRRDPGDGLLGALIREHGDEVDDVELGGLADGVFLGGYETSASMLALGTLVLLRNKDVYDAVARDEPGVVDRVVEELMRYLSVVQVAFPRFARHDLDLFGKRVSKGDLVSVSLSGANRDAEVFGPDAEVFDPDRLGGAGPGTAHLGFGHGFHRCVGSELARMELRCAFRALTGRFPDLSLAVEPSQLRFRDFSLVYGVESLPVRLVPGATATGAA
ncbi:MAG TPA: cytochrome P450 [Kribbellaceae bacterium]|nr:cytochrome P450 [Kribbellaceae bacterium]